MWSTFTLQKSFPSLCERIYKCYPNYITNFSSFDENQILLDPELDPSMSKNPFFTTRDNWKEIRAALTTGFSSRKLKSLFLSTREVSYKLKNYLTKLFERNSVIEVDLVQFWNKYTGEFVANVGFGMEGHCFEDTHNFQKAVSPMFGSSILTRAMEMISFYSPRLAKILRIRRVPKKVELFFRNAVKDVLEARKHNDENYNDFLQMMIEYQKTHGMETLDERTLTIYMEGFFLDAYESASITLSFLCFQLALYPVIQKKARKEIIYSLTKFGGELSYEGLNELNYLEQILNESIRLNATIPLLSKVCTQECQLLGNDGLLCKIKPGDITVISLYGLHMDPKYWPEPEKFDPERFNEEQKGSRSKFVFLPFGEGPRMCVGRRMAMIEMKVAMVQLLKDYYLELSPKTRIPVERDSNFSTMPECGLWVYVKPFLKD
ncbi:probable cytochrome P450 6d4 isoform X2 [Belonocnema kinseyi]|uniref:probable cytochrome P450 6d4 isoform X2 n=1 Tax=Belonocnema kinseyi TaxID=2817044 RepID=UPI00143CCBA8|nr:probable cytochrome P450 6d4 isoform X2 [Belonocnema kinseyi]